MLIAVLFAPGAGNARCFRELGALLSRRLAGHETLACPGPFGADFLPAAASCGFVEGDSYVASVRAATASLAARRPDLFVCVGGDGLASYAADALAGTGAAETPLLGVAAGTANVGPIVSIGPADLERLDVAALRRERVGAIDVALGGKHVAYGFNDVVIGTTFLGTVDQSAVSLSARAMAERGERVAEAPDPDIAGDDFAVEKNGIAAPRGLPRPAQIVAAPLGEREFYGRAIAGALCESAHSPNRAAVALLDSILVKPSSVDRGIGDFARVDHLLFGPGDRVVVRGLSAKAQVIVDGNPFLRGGRDVEFAYRPGLVIVARPDGSARMGARECT